MDMEEKETEENKENNENKESKESKPVKESKPGKEAKPAKEPEHKFLEEIGKYAADHNEQSFVRALTTNLVKTLMDKVKSELNSVVQDSVLPTVRNIEVQSALQISKTNETFAEAKKVTDHLFIQISKLNEHLNLLKANLITLNDKHEATSKLVIKKADLFELQAFAKELSSMTPLHTFYKFQDWAQSLASKDEVEKLVKSIEVLKDDIEDKPSLDYVQNELSKIILEARQELNKEKTLLMRKFVKLKETSSEHKEKIDHVKQSIKQTNDIVSKRFHEIMDQIEKKPWTGDFNALQADIKTKATLQQIEEIKGLYDPKIQGIIEKSQEIGEDLQEYSDVMARFDEVILTKASKEDIKVISQKMKSLVSQSSIDPVLSDYSQKFQKTEERLKSVSKLVDDVNDRITAYHGISTLLKTQTKDYTKMLDSIKSIKETLKHKADKSDIYSIFDVVGYKEDILALTSHVEKIKEMFLQTVVLQHDTVGTLMPSVDPQNAKNRVRAEVVKHLDIIAKKLANPPDRDSNTVKVDRSKKKMESLAPISLENTVDEKILSSRNNSVKHKRVFSAVGNKRFVNIL